MNDFLLGTAVAWICVLLYQILDRFIKGRRGKHIEIMGEQTQEVTTWVVRFRRENPEIHIWLNGRKWS